LRNHAHAIAAIDLCVVPTLTFECLFAFLVVGSAKSGIIMHPLGDRTERAVAPPPADADRGRDLPLGKKTAADAVGNAPIRSE
jgi:hypothetical protein